MSWILKAFRWVDGEAVRSSAGVWCVGGGSQLRLSQSLAICSRLPAGLVEVEAGVVVHGVEVGNVLDARAPIVLARLEWELRVGWSPCRVDWRWLGLHVEVGKDAVDDEGIVDERDDLEGAMADRAEQGEDLEGARFILHLAQRLRPRGGCRALPE